MAENTPTLSPNNATQMTSTGENKGRKALIAAGGIFGAIAASSCCILPLLLTVIGASGAWMANLRALSPYQPVFIALTAIFLAYGFYLVYWKPENACTNADVCTDPVVPGRVVKGTLWLATLLVMLAVSFSYWFPLITPYLP